MISVLASFSSNLNDNDHYSAQHSKERPNVGVGLVVGPCHQVGARLVAALQDGSNDLVEVDIVEIQ